MALFLHMAGIYRSSALSYIDLTLQEIFRPSLRSIPRPRRVQADPPSPEPLERPAIRTVTVPSPRPPKPFDVEKMTDFLPPERASVFALPALDAPEIREWIPPVSAETAPKIADRGSGLRESGGTSEYDSRRSYFNIVKLRIEHCKKYPRAARQKRIQGAVTVRFVVTMEGHINTARVMKSSGSSILDRAAVKAVQDAAPFPKPPVFSAKIFH